MKIYLYLLIASFSFFACGGSSSQTGETFLIEDGQPPVSVLVAPTLIAKNTAESVEVS